MAQSDKGKKKPARQWITVPVTAAMKEAIQRAARRKGINQTNFARMMIVGGTEYDESKDPDLKSLVREK